MRGTSYLLVPLPHWQAVWGVRGPGKQGASSMGAGVGAEPRPVSQYTQLGVIHLDSHILKAASKTTASREASARSIHALQASAIGHI